MCGKIADMARPAARVLAVLQLLQAGGTHTVADLAERLAVDERTVRRYIEHLRDLGIPVDGTRGRHGGCRLARHYRMPPLMLTDEEALAVVWALLLSGQSLTGPASARAADSAAAKVRRVLPAMLARRMDAVLETVDFTASRAVPPAGPGGQSRACHHRDPDWADTSPAAHVGGLPKPSSTTSAAALACARPLR
jgi:predicted DNA-binding transcriptional regulator YafY